VLLDTNILVWYALQPKQLTKHAVRAIAERGNLYSYVSLWEMAIKSSLGKLKLASARGQAVNAREFLLRVVRDLRLIAIPLEFDDLAAVEALPFHHKDPFDRLLVVQALRLKEPILSPDTVFDRYGVERVW
jgi:PIN domain nuclease of toxin-antitoxin system